MHSQEIGEMPLCLFIRLRDLYQDLLLPSVTQSIFLCLTVILLFDLALRDLIRRAIPDVVADAGYWENRLGIQ